MSKRSIYVAGPIGRTTDFHERFAQGSLEVRLLGHDPVNPLEVNPGVSADPSPEGWLKVIRADIHTLIECDGLYALRGWENSKGARLEHLIADGLGLEIIYQPEEGK